MKQYLTITALYFLCSVFSLQAQQQERDTAVYKKRVLQSTEVDYLMSYYTQKGEHAAVTGGVGTERLEDVTPTLVLKIPLNVDDVLTVDAGISAYSSASSGNLNPFDASGASEEYEDDEEEEGEVTPIFDVQPTGSPWIESSGASQKDERLSSKVKYSHSSDDRNTIWSGHATVSDEYDYTSFGLGGSITRLFNSKNTELSLRGQVLFDQWNPQYPAELEAYIEEETTLNTGFFNGLNIYNQQGNLIDKTGSAGSLWNPFHSHLLKENKRNTYSLSFVYSQIISKNAQFSLFFDLVRQNGWLSNPMQRVYFTDKANYYVGNPASIPNYTSSTNTDVFQLADDIERLPGSRFKLPVGARFNYFVSPNLTMRTYYRYYEDDWGVKAHTANIEFPVKLAQGKYTFYPTYRYYTQTGADYFAPFDMHHSGEVYYTSDYDLSAFNSHQFGMGFKYRDIFTNLEIFHLGFKSVNLRYNYYTRSDGLSANIISARINFVLQ